VLINTIISYHIYADISFVDMYYLGYISVRVSNNADIYAHTLSEECARWDESTFPADTSQTLECREVMYGRYVSIQRTPGDGAEYTQLMILCEVQVMGTDEYGKQLLSNNNLITFILKSGS
jgi:hypothetical protein